MVAEGSIAVIFNKDNHLLLIKRRDIPVWVLPGGGLETGETAENAIVREIKEETGLQVTIKRKIAEYTPINNLASFTHLFECIVTNGQLKITLEAKELGFFPLQELPNHFFYIHNQWLQDALKNEPLLIQKKLTQITYLRGLLYLFRHPIWSLRFILARLGIPINS